MIQDKLGIASSVKGKLNGYYFYYYHCVFLLELLELHRENSTDTKTIPVLMTQTALTLYLSSPVG